MKKRYRATLCWLICLLWTAVVFSFSLKSGEASAEDAHMAEKILEPLFLRLGMTELPSEHVIRKLAHFTEYAILGLLAAAAFTESLPRYFGGKALLYGVLAAAADEFVCQNLSVGRGASIFDVLLDSTGVFFGVLAVFLWLIFWQGRKNKQKISKNA